MNVLYLLYDVYVSIMSNICFKVGKMIWMNVSYLLYVVCRTFVLFVSSFTEKFPSVFPYGNYGYDDPM